MTRSAHPVLLTDESLLTSCEIRRQRRSGPGGQHRNKVETGIFIKHLPTNIQAAATEKRSQAANHKLAVERLRVNLAIQHRQIIDETDQPHEVWQGRCRNGRIIVSRAHHDFATVLAEAFDFLAAADHDMSVTADRLGCTRSQLTKLFKMESAAFQALNKQRQERGLSPLK